MKTIVLIVAVSTLLLACNQTEEKEIGTIDSTNTNTVKADTTTINTNPVKTDTGTINTNPVNPDTTTQKIVTTAPTVSLQNFWVLENVDGKPLDPKNFPNGTPYFELNVKKNKVSGHAGCNGINGSIKVQGKNIAFGNLITTKATCSAQDFENSYLSGLSDHTIPYRIEGAKLYLTLEPNRIFVYRKIEQ
jgi:heat shock protein HslJ